MDIGLIPTIRQGTWLNNGCPNGNVVTKSTFFIKKILFAHVMWCPIPDKIIFSLKWDRVRTESNTVHMVGRDIMQILIPKVYHDEGYDD